MHANVVEKYRMRVCIISQRMTVKTLYALTLCSMCDLKSPPPPPVQPSNSAGDGVNKTEQCSVRSVTKGSCSARTSPRWVGEKIDILGLSRIHKTLPNQQHELEGALSVNLSLSVVGKKKHLHRLQILIVLW